MKNKGLDLVGQIFLALWISISLYNVVISAVDIGTGIVDFVTDVASGGSGE